MTITDLTVGAVSFGINNSLTPGTPSGLVAGDFMVIVAAIRNSGAGTPNTPTGWTKISDNGNLCVFGRYFETGDVMPLVSFTGGVANADTYVRALKARGVAKDMLSEAPGSIANNSSQQNIAFPSYDVLGDDHLLLMALWKQDDCTSIATPGGWTSQGLTNMTSGDDMLVQLYTQLQTTAADITGSAAVVTGGTAQIGRGSIVALRPAPAIAVTAFDLFPPRNAVSVTGLTPGDDVLVYRIVDGERTLLRGGSASTVTDTSLVVVDGELPFGVPVSYVAVVNSVAEYETAQATYTLPGGKPVLSDAITGESSQFVIVSWPEKQYQRQASVFAVGGRNVVVSGDLGMFEGRIEIFFEAWSSSEQFLELLNGATEGVLQLRRPVAGYDGVDCYLAVLGANETRFSQDGTDERRTWVLEVAETESWSDGFTARAFTYADVTTFYTGLTYADLLDDHARYVDLLLADFTP